MKSVAVLVVLMVIAGVVGRLMYVSVRTDEAPPPAELVFAQIDEAAATAADPRVWCEGFVAGSVVLGSGLLGLGLPSTSKFEELVNDCLEMGFADQPVETFIADSPAS